MTNKNLGGTSNGACEEFSQHREVGGLGWRWDCGRGGGSGRGHDANASRSGLAVQGRAGQVEMLNLSRKERG